MRIDKYLAETFGSRSKAAAAIAKGLVLVNHKPTQASYDFNPDKDVLEILEAKESFVSNGGYKLSKALKDFNLSVEGNIIADIGASNGGFTDCLLQNGAKKIYCIDVGESQLDRSLDRSKLVIVDNFNARYLNTSLFSEPLNGAVIDVSFISLTYILGSVASVLPHNAFLVALIKPQFECESKTVGKNGIVKDAAQHKRILRKIYDFAISVGLIPNALTNAPIIKGKNLEYLMLFYKSDCVVNPADSAVNLADSLVNSSDSANTLSDNATNSQQMSINNSNPSPVSFSQLTHNVIL